MTNAVRAAHAAYDLTLDDREWLEHLSSIVGPLLDRGRGLVAFRWHHTPDEGVQPDEMVVTGGRAGDESMLRALLANLDRHRAYLAYGAPYRYRSLSEIARDHPTIDDVTDDLDMQRLAHEREVLDFEMLRVDEAAGRGWMFSVLRSEVGGLHTPRRELWERVAAHIAAGARLRRQLAASDLDRADAIYDPASGDLSALASAWQHADRRTRLLELIEARRRAQSTADTDPVRGMALWEGLIDGLWSLLDIVDTDGRTYTILRENPLRVRSGVALSERERQVAFLIGRGDHPKLVAYELGLSPSTVRSQLRSALRKLNLDDRSALHRLVATLDGTPSATSLDALGLLALADRPPSMPASLTAAERDVAELVYAGHSNAEVAARRGTSVRTVANQLAAVFRKLDVDSRAELVLRLAHDPPRVGERHSR